MSIRLIDNIPSEIEVVTTLQVLYINYNHLRKIPSEIGNLINLHHLELNNNDIRRIPSSFGNLINLNHLDLSHNSLSRIPKSFIKLTKLKHLNLRHNLFTEIPPLIFNFKNLTFLQMGYNRINFISDEIGNLTNLEYLDLNNNENLIELPMAIGKLKKIDDFSGSKSLTEQFEYALKMYEKTEVCKGKVFTRHILLKQGILNSKKYSQLFLLFEKMCEEVKGEKDIYKLRGMAESLEIEGVEMKTKEEMCSEIGAEILIKLNLASRFE